MAGDGGEAAWIATGRKLQAAGVTHINMVAPLDLSPAQGLERVIAARTVLAGALGVVVACPSAAVIARSVAMGQSPDRAPAYGDCRVALLPAMTDWGR